MDGVARVTRGGLILAALNLGTAALGFAFWLLVVRLLSPDEVGLASAIIAAGQPLGLLASFGTGFALLRFFREPTADGRRILREALFFCLLASPLLGIILTLSGAVWAGSASGVMISPAGAVVIVLLVLSTALVYIVQHLLIAMRHEGRALLSGAVFSASRLPLLLLLLPLGLMSIPAAFAAGGLAAFGVSAWLAARSGDAQVSFSPAAPRRGSGKALAYSSTNLTVELLYLLPFAALPLLNVTMLGATEAARFYVYWVIAWMIYSAPAGTSLSLLAEAATGDGAQSAVTARALRVALLLAAAGGAGFSICFPFIDDFFGAAYAVTDPTLVLALAGAAPVLVTLQWSSTILRMRERMTSAIALAVIASVASIGSSFVLLTPFGLAGVAVGWLFGQGLALPVAWILVKRSGPVAEVVR